VLIRPTGAVFSRPILIRQRLYDAKEHTMAEIAEIVGVPRSTLYKHLSEDKVVTA
jgi:DNA-binding phage protein